MTLTDSLPEREAELASARAVVAKLEVRHSRFVEKLEAVEQVPQSFWSKANDLESEWNSALAGVRRIELEIEAHRGRHIDAEHYRKALVAMNATFDAMNAVEKADLLRYLITDLRVSETKISIALLGELSEEGELVGPSGEYLQPLKWLPLLDSNQRHSD